MFGFFKQRKIVETEFAYDQAVIIEILFDGSAEFGTDDDRREVTGLEDEIEMRLPEKAELDGHEFGGCTATIYIYGPSAKDIFDRIETVLQKSHFSKMDITLRFGLVDDPNAIEKHFTLY